ncbi:YfhO family protein, partial [Enterococcus faecium]
TINQTLTEFEVYQEYWEPLKKVTSTYASFDKDNLYYDFPSVSGFSSMNNKKYLLMLTRLGYSTSNVRAKRNGGTVITDILLSNQYQVIPNQEIQHQATSGVKIIESEVS